MGHNEFRRQVGRMATPINKCTLGCQFLNYDLQTSMTHMQKTRLLTPLQTTLQILLSLKYTTHLSHLVFIMHLSHLWKVNCDSVYIPCMHTGFLRSYKRFILLYSSDILSVVVFPSGRVCEKKQRLLASKRNIFDTNEETVFIYTCPLFFSLSFPLFLSLFFFFCFSFDKPSHFFEIRP